MSPRKGGPSTEPLTEDEELRVKAWIDARVRGGPYPEREIYLAHVCGVFFYLGMHPACLAQKEKYNLRAEEHWIRWNRTKQWQAIKFPVTPELAGWAVVFINEVSDCHPISYNHMVHEAGRLMGIPHLTPRSLRHTVCARLMEKTGFNTAKMLTGTTDEILVNYGKRAALKSDLAKLAAQGFS